MTTLDTIPGAPTDIVTAVREAEAAAPKRPRGGVFSLTTASAGERAIAPVFGLYLGYAVARLPEVFAQMAIPKLPMILLLIFLGMLALVMPRDAMEQVWHRSKALRLVGAIAGVATLTAFIGIWPNGSIWFLRERYVISLAIFVCCLVFLRDRRNLRVAMSLYVLCVAAVSADMLHTYDPNAPVFDSNGEPLDPAELAARPDLKRLKQVGVSLDPNDFGAVLCTAFPIALWLSVGNFGRRVFWSAIAILLIAAVVPTQSRGSEIGLLSASIVVIGIGARGWRRWLTIALVGGAAALFIMMALGIGAAGRFTDFSSDDYNLTNSGRWYFWRQGFVWMLKRPWGYGISNFNIYFGMLNGNETAAHSTWVQYGMELGIAGISIFVFLCYTLIQRLREQRRLALALADSHPQAKDEIILTGHMLALLTGVLITGTFLSNAYYPLMYMTLGVAGATLLGSPLPASTTPTSSTTQTSAAASTFRISRHQPRRMRAAPPD